MHNSVANVPKALYPLGSYERIHCFFDNDRAGMEAIQQIRKEYEATRYIRDASQIYSGCKDLNEYLQDVYKRQENNNEHNIKKGHFDAFVHAVGSEIERVVECQTIQWRIYD